MEFIIIEFLTIHIIIVILSFGISVFEAIMDSIKINYGKKIEHKISATVRVILCFSASFIVYSNFLGIFSFGILLLLVYWIPFDATINIMRGKPLSYIGNTAKTDKILRKLNFDGESFLIAKLILLAIYTFIHFNLL